MFFLLDVVLTPVWVWLIFDEIPSTQALIGGAIVSPRSSSTACGGMSAASRFPKKSCSFQASDNSPISLTTMR